MPLSRARSALPRQLGVAVNRVGGAAELARHDAGDIRHLIADQEIGLPARQVRQHVARHQLDLYAYCMLCRSRGRCRARKAPGPGL